MLLHRHAAAGEETLMLKFEKTNAPMVLLDGPEGGGGRSAVHLFK